MYESTIAISCVVLTLNEEVNLPTLLGSAGYAEQVIVVDSGSSDKTVAIARALGAEVLENPWPGYAQQRNWALEHSAVRHDWVLFIDADEQVSQAGWEEIGRFIAAPAGHRAASFRRSVHMFGRQLRHGGFNSARVSRLLDRRYCRFLERPVHEHAIVDGPVYRMRVPIIHDDRKPFSSWLDRHNQYSSLEAQARLSPTRAGSAGTVQFKSWLRIHVWPRLPARPLLFFVYIYLIRLGFLDGTAGLRIAALYGFQELSVQVKLEELTNGSVIPNVLEGQ